MSYFDIEPTLTGGKPIFLYKFFGTGIGTWRFNNSVSDFFLSSETYSPWPVKHEDVAINMTGDRNDLQITIAAGSTLDQIYTDYPPSGILNVVVRRTHADYSAALADCPVIWQGRVAGIEFTPTSEVEFTCQPTHAGTRRPGLRRNYQITCPLLLYGVDCRASKAAATRTATVAAVGVNTITLNATVGTADQLTGGTIQWTDGGQSRVHQIRAVSANSLVITIPQRVRGIVAGNTVTLVYGCNHTMRHCRDLHDNILNFGGQPFIPLENPATSQSSIFY